MEGLFIFLVAVVLVCVAVLNLEGPHGGSRRPSARRAKARLEADERVRAERAAQGARDELALKQMMYIDLVWTARGYLDALSGWLAAAGAGVVAGEAEAADAAGRAFAESFARVRASLPAEVLAAVQAAAQALDGTGRRVRVGSAFDRVEEARGAVAAMAVVMRRDLGVGESAIGGR